MMIRGSQATPIGVAWLATVFCRMPFGRICGCHGNRGNSRTGLEPPLTCGAPRRMWCILRCRGCHPTCGPLPQAEKVPEVVKKTPKFEVPKPAEVPKPEIPKEAPPKPEVSAHCRGVT